MARGRKPTPPHLRLVEGTYREDRHGPVSPGAVLTDIRRPVRPARMSRGAVAAWKKFIEPAGWLDWTRGAAAAAFCELWAEFQAAPARFPSAKHSQMRAYMADLGLTDARRRIVQAKAQPDEFFDD